MDLPMIVRLTGRLVVVVGGGKVALRRAHAFVDAGADVHVIAPEIHPELAALPVSGFERAYRQGDLDQAFLVVIATSDAETNEAVARDARRLNILINRTDQPDLGDVVIPAHAQRGPLTLAVHTGGISARAAADIRDNLLDCLDDDYITLLETVAPFRERFKKAIHDPALRRTAMRALTGETAMATLKADGEEALHAYCESLLKQSTEPRRSQ